MQYTYIHPDIHTPLSPYNMVECNQQKKRKLQCNNLQFAIATDHGFL